jgi:ankyrin repeat protein
MSSTGAYFLPTELLLLIAAYLGPLDQISLPQVFPGIAGLFNHQQFATTDENGDTILHLQARAKTTADGSGDTEASVDSSFFPALLVCSEGTSLHPRNRDGDTPLLEAACVGNIPFMKLLLEKDPAGLNIANNHGLTPLWSAVLTKNTAAISLLLEQPNIRVNHEMTEGEDNDAHQITPFVYALWHGWGDYDVVSLLIKHPETDLAFPDASGMTPIHLAIDQGRENLVRDMLETGRLDVNITGGRGHTPLHHAVAGRRGNVRIVKLLLAQDGIDVNRPTDTGETPLMRSRSPRCVKRLLAHPGIEIDRVDDFGWSALGYVAYQGDMNCAQVLLRHGAQPDLVDLDGYTPRDRAEQANHA